MTADKIPSARPGSSKRLAGPHLVLPRSRPPKMPQTGAYYWIPVAPVIGAKARPTRWQLVVFFDSEGDTAHVRVWARHVVPLLRERWGSSLPISLVDAYTALPRGRVTKTRRGYGIFHGNNAPIAHIRAMARIIRAFGLPPLDNRTFEAFDEHETVLEHDAVWFRRTQPSTA